MTSLAKPVLHLSLLIFPVLAGSCAFHAAPGVSPVPGLPQGGVGGGQERPAGTRAPAEEGPQPVGTMPDVPEVVISAARDELSRYRTPVSYGAARDVISPEEVREMGALNIQELLRRTPSIFFFEETGTDSKPNISVRGITGADGSQRCSNVSLMADGVPLAPAPYGHAGQSLFPFTLERVHAVDVVRGGRTVRYGPNTVSGVINFLTRPIPERSTFEQGLRVNSYGDFSTFTGLGGKYDKLGIWAESVSKIGDTYRDHGNYKIQNHALKMSYDFSETLRGLFQVDYFDDKSDLSDGLSLAAYKDDPEQSQARKNKFEGDQLRANFRVEWDMDPESRLEFTGFIFAGDRTFFLGKPLQYGGAPSYIDATPRPMAVWALQPQYSHKYEFQGAECEVTVGVRHQVEDVVRKSERLFPDGSKLVRSDNDYDYHVWSAYVDNTFKFDRFKLTPGIRFEAADIDGRSHLTGVTQSRHFTELLPALSASYMVDRESSIYANIQSSFLPPQAAHVELSAKPQNLEAQYAWTYEVGTRGRYFDGLLSSDLALYWIDYKDRIERDPEHDDVYYNTGNTTHRGVELALDSDLAALTPELAGFEMSGSVSYGRAKYTHGDFNRNTVAQAPNLLASWGVKYHDYESGFWGGIDGYYVGWCYSDAANTGPVNTTGVRGKRPAYTVWNARAGWDLQLAPDIRLRTQVGCNNLLDEEYYDIRAGKGILPGPPLGVYTQIGLTVEF